MLQQTLIKSFIGAALLAFLSVASVGSAATIIDTTFASNTGPINDDQLLLQNATATWTINPGVTVTMGGSSRFFIETHTAPDGGSEFIVDGGGTLTHDSTSSCCAVRLGHLVLQRYIRAIYSGSLGSVLCLDRVVS